MRKIKKELEKRVIFRRKAPKLQSAPKQSWFFHRKMARRVGGALNRKYGSLGKERETRTKEKERKTEEENDEGAERERRKGTAINTEKPAEKLTEAERSPKANPDVAAHVEFFQGTELVC